MSHHILSSRRIAWSSLLVSLIFAIVSVFITMYRPTPRTWPLYVDQPEFSYPYSEGDIVPFWTIPVVGGIFSFLVPYLIERYYIAGHPEESSSKHASPSRKPQISQTPWLKAAAVFFAIIESFLWTLGILQIMKFYVGEPRPDYIQRCLNQGDTFQEIKSSMRLECDRGAGGIFSGGRRSFPSGHASLSMSIGWFLTLYMIHAIYFRHARPRHDWSNQMLHTLFPLFLIPLIASLFIGASRIVEHDHSPTDVVMGFLLGVWLSSLVFLRLVASQLVDLDRSEHERIPASPFGGGMKNASSTSIEMNETHV